MVALLQMDARSLAMEMAPIIIWNKDRRPESYRQFWNYPSKTQSKTNGDPAHNFPDWDMLAGDYSDLHTFLTYICLILL